jgi:anti-anti-sigma factor
MSAIDAVTRTNTTTPAGARTLDGVAYLRLTDSLTAVTAPSLRAPVRQAVQGDGERRLLIDLQAVTSVDAAGVAAVLGARGVLEAQPSGTLVLRANEMVCRALKDTGTFAAFAPWNGSGM